ncbi:hypothetical protein CLAM6_01170 [Cobetia sp. AM6]|nr:hypothetical protein CLAM6_01170 [Cobetia sp. AM6]
MPEVRGTVASVTPCDGGGVGSWRRRKGDEVHIKGSEAPDQGNEALVKSNESAFIVQCSIALVSIARILALRVCDLIQVTD